MANLEPLQNYLQNNIDISWEITMRSYATHKKHRNAYQNFDEVHQQLLSSFSNELDEHLTQIAMEEYNNNNSSEPIDFSAYVRYYSSMLGHKEVFVGNKWVLVPQDSCVEFREIGFGNSRGFRVEITHNNNYANFESTETLSNFERFSSNSYTGEKLIVESDITNDIVSEREHKWLRMAGTAYQGLKKGVTTLDNGLILYNRIPKEFKRTYAYKISKTSKKLGKPLKAGKIYHSVEKLAKKGKILGPLGNILTSGSITYELATDSWDAHTVVDGALLVVGVAAVYFGAPLVITGIAIYGIADFIFDIGSGFDDTIGRNSGLWDSKPIEYYTKDSKPLFLKETHNIEIDNTFVDLPKRPKS